MIYVYGGAFDPVTKAHLEIIKYLHKHLHEGDNLLLTISNDDEKNYRLTYQQRFDLLRTTLRAMYKSEELPMIAEQQYRMHYWLHKSFDFLDKVNLVMGEDEWNDLVNGKWVHSKELLKEVNFTVFTREDGEILEPKTECKGYTVVKFPETAAVSSSKIRWKFYLNPETKYKEVQDSLHLTTFKLIKEMGYYHQNGEKYEAEMKEFLEDYARKKEANHWGEPSVTTDVVAYNGDQILLIRRKKPPFKNFWALPGGFFEKTDSDLNAGVAREFREETTLDYPPEAFQQIRAYGHDFDPRMKICDVAFAVRVHHQDMKKARGDDDAAEAQWFDMHDLPPLAFHHSDIVNHWMDFVKP